MTQIELPTTHITAYKWDPIVSPYGSGGGFGSSTFDREGPLRDGPFGSGAQGALYNWAQANYDAITKKVKSGYSEKQKRLPQTLESELAAVRADGDTSKLPPVEAVTRELAVRDILIGRKTAELARQNKLANAFYGSDPLDKTAIHLASQYRPRQLLPAVKTAWSDSYTAAYNSKLLSEGIALLNNQSAALKIELTTLQARIAAEAKAKRVADEQARIAAEAKAQRLAAEAAELARLAAEAEAKRVADEQARVAAEAEAQRVAAEAEAKRVADEQARIAAEAEAKRVADEQARIAAEAQAVRAANTFRIPAATGTVQLSAAAGSIAMTPGSTLTLDLAIERAIAVIKLLRDAATVETAAGLASRWIPFAALVWPSSLGNSDLYPTTALTLPAKTLAPDLVQNLPEIAAAGGTVDVPYRIYGDRTKYSVIATQTSGGVSPKVPVRALTLDPALNAYTFTTTETQPRTLIFPIASPGSSSTATPAQPVDTPVYTGVTLTPIEVKAEALPAIDWLSIKDAIYHYPIESGLPPIYAVFSSPYEGATTKGEHSGRMYNPDKAGGPTQNLDWTTASVALEGIDLVKLHTGRFPPSDANKIMIDRLEKILRGEISITDIDKRFYTHEIRELERYRALGVADGVEPNDDGTIWNNAHAAALEDYKLKDASDLFYTPEATEADFKQVERENK